MKYQLVNKITNEIVTPHYIGLAPNGQLYSDGLNVTEHYHIRRFTGLRDKNGTPVYEGDILKILDEGCAKVFFSNDYLAFYIEWLDIRGGTALSVWRTNELEVIGHIYSNPELLKEEVK